MITKIGNMGEYLKPKWKLSHIHVNKSDNLSERKWKLTFFSFHNIASVGWTRDFGIWCKKLVYYLGFRGPCHHVLRMPTFNFELDAYNVWRACVFSKQFMCVHNRWTPHNGNILTLNLSVKLQRLLQIILLILFNI